jgi:hypothetical protein
MEPLNKARGTFIEIAATRQAAHGPPSGLG